MAAPLTASEIAQELADYEVVVSENALGHLVTYQKLLLRWNRRINLTALRTPRRIVRQLFGESLSLTRVLVLRGRAISRLWALVLGMCTRSSQAQPRAVDRMRRARVSVV